jgi:hypothetical protein
LARETALPNDVDLVGRFKGWPKQSGLDPFRLAMAAWFEDGEPPWGEKTRLPFQLGETKDISDPIWRARELARGELRRLFSTTRTVCFTFQGR